MSHDSNFLLNDGETGKNWKYPNFRICSKIQFLSIFNNCPIFKLWRPSSHFEDRPSALWTLRSRSSGFRLAKQILLQYFWRFIFFEEAKFTSIFGALFPRFDFPQSTRRKRQISKRILLWVWWDWCGTFPLQNHYLDFGFKNWFVYCALIDSIGGIH